MAQCSQIRSGTTSAVHTRTTNEPINLAPSHPHAHIALMFLYHQLVARCKRTPNTHERETTLSVTHAQPTHTTNPASCDRLSHQPTAVVLLISDWLDDRETCTLAAASSTVLKHLDRYKVKSEPKVDVFLQNRKWNRAMSS